VFEEIFIFHACFLLVYEQDEAISHDGDGPSLAQTIYPASIKPLETSRPMRENITIIKYGTAVLTAGDDINGAIDTGILKAHAHIIDNYGGDALIVSSGAVGMAQTLLDHTVIQSDAVTRKRLLAEIGQPRLFAAWQAGFARKQVLQKLVTYADLRRPTMASTMHAALDHNFVMICNFNDGVDDSELRENSDHQFGDNDHLAGEMALTCKRFAKSVRLIINTSADGFVSADSGKVVSELDINILDDDFIAHHTGSISSGGTGGMASKLINIRNALTGGVDEAWIINGRKPDQLSSILTGGDAGTKILAQA